MNKTGFNFSAGPALLPIPVLEALSSALIDCEGSGYSLFELPHRGDAFLAILPELEQRTRALLNVPDEFDVLFTPGGATMQFSAVPLNLCTQGYRGGYIISGYFSEEAYKEADRISSVYPLWNGGAATLPIERLEPARGTDFVFYCDNETADGKEFSRVPNIELGDAALVADVSSNIFSRPIDWSRHGAVFASLQKNMGTAGASIVIVRRDLYGSIGDRVPMLLDWRSYARENNMPGTPPMVAMYTALLMLRWLDKEGGVEVMDERAKARSAKIYSVLDAYPDFYLGVPSPEVRSRINVVFKLPNSELEACFLKESDAAGLYGLKGHFARGGIRASLYNAMPQAGADALSSFLQYFHSRHA